MTKYKNIKTENKNIISQLNKKKKGKEPKRRHKIQRPTLLYTQKSRKNTKLAA